MTMSAEPSSVKRLPNAGPLGPEGIEPRWVTASLAGMIVLMSV